MTKPTIRRTTEHDDPPADDRDRSLLRCFDVEIRASAEDDKARAIEVVASTDALDSHGTIIEQSFDLKRYKRNPVVLFNHNRTADAFFGGGDTNAVFPIARAENVRVEEGQLQARLVFASAEANPLAEQVRLLMKEKILRGVSIGFRRGPKTQVVEEKGEDGQPMMAPGGYPVLRIKRAELVEISVLPIGSNPEAVSRGIGSERDMVRSWTGEDEAKHEDDPMPEPVDTKIQTELARANADLTIAREQLETERAKSAELQARVTKLETDATETSKKLGEAESRAKKAETELTEITIKGFVGKKITPAEVDEQKQLAAEIGLERVSKMLEKRADLPHSKDITGNDPNPHSQVQRGSGASLRIVQAATSKPAAG